MSNRSYSVLLGYDTNANGQLEAGEYSHILNAKVLRWDRILATNAWSNGVAEDATEEDSATPALYLLTNTNGLGQIALQEKLWPGVMVQRVFSEEKAVFGCKKLTDKKGKLVEKPAKRETKPAKSCLWLDKFWC